MKPRGMQQPGRLNGRGGRHHQRNCSYVGGRQGHRLQIPTEINVQTSAPIQQPAMQK